MENQATVIACYAERHQLDVIETFSDGGKSGLLFKNRPALNRLLQEVISGAPGFKAILVYDVSRWGRFQDCDEAAHYEFLCKHAGVPIHYCAEEFAANDGLTSSVLKAIKRAMAAEFSRELGDKVFIAEKRWAQLGYKQGGAAGYALRRMMISSDGTRRQLLKSGEAKCLQNDRVILVPGDRQEVERVREIYRLVVMEKKNPHWIACELNKQGKTQRGRKWTHQLIRKILTDPKYAGACVWNRSTRRLGGPNVPVPRSDWIVKPGAFEPVVELETFDLAQQFLSGRRLRTIPSPR